MLEFDMAAVFLASASGGFRSGQRMLHFTGAVITGILSGIFMLIARDLLCGMGAIGILTSGRVLGAAVAGGVLGFVLVRRLGGTAHVRKTFACLEGTALGLGAAAGLLRGLYMGLPVTGCVMLGVLTGIAGSVARDVCLAEMPLTVAADFHFMAAAIGAMFGFGLALAGLSPLAAGLGAAAAGLLLCLFGFWRRTRTGQADLDY